MGQEHFQARLLKAWKIQECVFLFLSGRGSRRGGLHILSCAVLLWDWVQAEPASRVVSQGFLERHTHWWLTVET